MRLKVFSIPTIFLKALAQTGRGLLKINIYHQSKYTILQMFTSKNRNLHLALWVSAKTRFAIIKPIQ